MVGVKIFARVSTVVSSHYLLAVDAWTIAFKTFFDPVDRSGCGRRIRRRWQVIQGDFRERQVVLPVRVS